MLVMRGDHAQKLEQNVTEEAPEPHLNIHLELYKLYEG